MSLIYTCDVCGMKTTDLGAALEHEKHCFARSVKAIDLSWDCSKNDFVFSVNFLRFSPDTPTRRERIYDSGFDGCQIYTEDMTEEHELACKKKLYTRQLKSLQAILKVQTAALEKLKELGEKLKAEKKGKEQ